MDHQDDDVTWPKILEMPFTPHMALQTVQVQGKVTYNDRELDRFVVHRTAAFMDQQDEHIPCLTVRETLQLLRALPGQRAAPRCGDDLMTSMAASQQSGRAKAAVG